jgi:phospholipid/cholesterol/gamma-HCH transport system ATP-binding protein
MSLLYDEPTTGLDPIRSDVINELILKLQRELKITHIVVHPRHGQRLQGRSAHRDAHEAKLIFDGTPQEIQNTDDPRLKRFVLGEATEEELATLRR